MAGFMVVCRFGVKVADANFEARQAFSSFRTGGGSKSSASCSAHHEARLASTSLLQPLIVCCLHTS